MTTQNRSVLREASAVGGAVVGSSGGGKYLIRVIQWGEGSSAFYPKEVLERDGAKAFPKNTKVYLDHPTESEEWDHPERSVRKIGGYTTEDAYYENGALYAPVQFGREATVIVEDFREVLGMSIYAFGDHEIGTIGDYTGPVLTSFDESVWNSIDVVTVPGAGGAILERLTESLKAFGTEPKAPRSEANIPKKEAEMAEIQDVLDAVGALTAQVSALVTVQETAAKAEVSDEAIESAVKDRLDSYDETVQAIESAEILDSQKAALRKEAKAGKDVKESLADAVAIAKEAREKFASADQPHRESGQYGERITEGYKFKGFRTQEGA